MKRKATMLFGTALVSQLSAEVDEVLSSRQFDQNASAIEAPCQVEKAFKKGFYLGVEGSSSSMLAEEFISEPEKFLKQRGLSFERIRCPDIVHKKMDKSNDFAEKAKNIVEERPLNSELIVELTELAKDHFGKNMRVELIPYGLKFLEKMELSGPEDGTITASGTITFADGDTDADG